MTKKMVATKYGIKLIPKTKRESFLPEDKEWLASNPNIKIGKKLGQGAQGVVYEVKDRPSMVVKVPLPYKYSNRTPSERERYIRQEEDEFLEEWRSYENLNLGDEPLIIPTKFIRITNKRVKGSFSGLVRPKVKVIGNYLDDYMPTDEELEQIRQKLIVLSSRGIAIKDGLQVGKDRKGRIQLYDLGFIENMYPSKAARNNEYIWELFLRGLDKSVKTYGMVNPSGGEYIP